MAQGTRGSAAPLSDLLMQLEDYNPTIPDAVTSYYLNTAGFEASDARLVRLISLAAQKFISDIANDALQHCRMRSHQQGGGKQGSAGGGAAGAGKVAGKDKRYTLTMDDLAPVLAEYGVTVKKPHYYL
ncbi:transcription initiation factor TFIID subunit 10-like [Hyalella azteca]|uniref:Transcription initiation factor TFIID subunit 10-like n=1 Tax=Hyalella azteca TaxID=294128 RepID=A0A8B7P381_HYAAZ|nr:transcription initiation factor TFIID subunit 10-like [Hyalella azteca]XP_047738225.1 transcription initiation factor TFIID subunit 10-like [Hyalella azteca]